MAAAPPPPSGLSAELCAAAAAELQKLSAVIKVYGCPVAPADLERMKGGGVQDRKDDLMRLTSNQLNDTTIFARLLQQFLEGCKAGRYPKGQAIELMGRTVGAPAPARLVGSSLASGPKIAEGLRASVGGAAFKPQSTGTHDRQLSEIVTKCLEASQATLAQGAVNREILASNGLQLERITRHVDAVMVQRVFRDTLRSCKATAGMGMDALRLLSPLADAVEHTLAATLLDSAFALSAEALPLVRAAVNAARAPIAQKLGAAGRSLDADLAALAVLEQPKPAVLAPAHANAEHAAPLPQCLKVAAAATRGLDLGEQSGGFAGAVYRRVVVAANEPVFGAVVALGAIVEAAVASAPAQIAQAAAAHPVFRAASKPAPVAAPAASKAPGPASASAGKPPPSWPPLRPEELTLLADRVFDAAAAPKDALPGAAAGGRGPARTLITLRGDWVTRTQLLALCAAALRAGGPLQEPKRSQVQAAQTFLAGLEDRVREELLFGLYQMATGDPDQRTRQVGFYFATQATAVLKPGLTLGPLRVAFAKYWRQVEGGG
jgi:hypothetical protein